MTPTTKLLELARKATPGVWGVEDPMDHCLTIVSNPEAPVYDWKWVATCNFPDEDEQLLTSREVKANAAFISAANPSTIIALVEQRDALLRASKVAREALVYALAGQVNKTAAELADSMARAALDQIRAAIALSEPTETQVTR